jgi:acyl carrier protein
MIVIAVFVAWLSFGSERAFRRELAGREWLSDGEFYLEFYAGTEIREEIPRRLLPIYCKFFNIEVGKLRPRDRPPEIADLDALDLVRGIEAEFGVHFSDDDLERIDGSFDSIVQYLARRAK